MPKRNKRKRRTLPVILAPTEATSLLNAARAAIDRNTTPTKKLGSWRDFVMVQTGILAGPRISELCDLKVTDIDLVGAVLSIVQGKGDKDRNIPIGKKLLRVLEEWIGERTDGYLFPGPKGKRLNPRTFQYRLDTLASAAGIKKNVHPHLMRHSFATSLLRSGADISEIQQLLGHANLATTALYLSVDVSRLMPAVDRL